MSLRMKYLYITLIGLISILNVSYGQDIEVEFNSEYSIESYLNKYHVERKHTTNLKFDKDKINTSIIAIGLNKQGEIKSIEFLKKGFEDDFNNMTLEMAQGTNKKWNVKYEPGFDDTFYVIMPFIQGRISYASFPDDKPFFDQAYMKIQALRIEDLNFCEGKNCVLIPTIRHLFGETVK